ncbi:DUF3306 domain-containing protein [Vibrio sp. T187]|uniref:DUF3306 domain-containing protein n=1 Tax=Vibrio TaxID=662 RepID=UPI0010CA160F|nr:MULTISPECIES: DUF3306 domain-containing protein [Vibrio]MBW3697845.1 DUF3306 domain-containing protein [Vibrio sp. T187]
MASSFLSRWSQRKFEQEKNQNEPEVPDQLDVDSTASVSTSTIDIQADTSNAEDAQLVTNNGEKGDELDSEQPGSVAALLATGAEAAVKKAALRKLFLSGEFSEVDALNDYDHDYKAVKSLSSDVASKLRGWAKEQIEEEPEHNVEHVVSNEDTNQPTDIQASTNQEQTSCSVEPQTNETESLELIKSSETTHADTTNFTVNRKVDP